ncbi:MAG: prepilin peptidase, partial [Acidimicrobiia bacterium]
AAAAARFDWSWELPAFCVLFAALLAIAVIDLAHYVIPNRILGPATVLGMALLGVAAVGEAEFGAFGRALAGGSAAFAGLLVTNLISPRGMGMGDVKLSFLLGLHLGWLGWGEVALGFFSAFFLSAVVGIFLVALRVRTRSEAIPFGPFLALGTVMTVLVGEPVLRWYSGA